VTEQIRLADRIRSLADRLLDIQEPDGGLDYSELDDQIEEMEETIIDLRAESEGDEDQDDDEEEDEEEEEDEDETKV
jgi:hypothetical protein